MIDVDRIVSSLRAEGWDPTRFDTRGNAIVGRLALPTPDTMRYASADVRVEFSGASFAVVVQHGDVRVVRTRRWEGYAGHTAQLLSAIIQAATAATRKIAAEW